MREEASLRETLAGFFVNPRKHPDFFWAFVARLVIVLGFQSVLSFQLYILADYVGLGLAEANTVYPIAVTIGTVALILALVPAGVISDRIGRRKIIVVIGAVLVVAVSTIPPLIAPTVTSALISIGIAGLGIGIYLAVDQALMTQVLPNKADAGKDLGVLNIAQAGGQVLAPVAASVVIGLAGYAALYVFAAVLAARVGARDPADQVRSLTFHLDDERRHPWRSPSLSTELSSSRRTGRSPSSGPGPGPSPSPRTGSPGSPEHSASAVCSRATASASWPSTRTSSTRRCSASRGPGESSRR